MAKKVHFVGGAERDRAAYAGDRLHGECGEPIRSKPKATADRTKVTCANCKKKLNWRTGLL